MNVPMRPQPIRDSDDAPWRWCRPGCPYDHATCVSWWGERATLATDYAPPGPGPCVAAELVRGLWVWVYDA
jgi:hypothetical protein